MSTMLGSLAQLLRCSLREFLGLGGEPAHLIVAAPSRAPEAASADVMPEMGGTHAATTAAAEAPTEPVLTSSSSNFLLAARLAGVARLNGPAARAGCRNVRTTAINRPVAKPAEPVKASQPAAWILARRISPERPARPATAKIIELRSVRPQRGTRRTGLPLAA